MFRSATRRPGPAMATLKQLFKGLVAEAVVLRQNTHIVLILAILHHSICNELKLCKLKCVRKLISVTVCFVDMSKY